MKKKMFFLYLFSFLATVSPVSVFVILNWDKYIHDVPAGALRLSVGGIVAAFVVLLKVLGKLKINGSMRWYLIGAVLCYTLQAILDDLGAIFLLAAIGEAIDYLFFRGKIEKLKKQSEQDELIDKFVDKMKGEAQT